MTFGHRGSWSKFDENTNHLPYSSFCSSKFNLKQYQVLSLYITSYNMLVLWPESLGKDNCFDNDSFSCPIRIMCQSLVMKKDWNDHGINADKP